MLKSNVCCLQSTFINVHNILNNHLHSNIFYVCKLPHCEVSISHYIKSDMCHSLFFDLFSFRNYSYFFHKLEWLGESMFIVSDIILQYILTILKYINIY